MREYPIYLDNCATTRLDPRVRKAMLPYLDVHYGNAASRSHRFGWDAEEAVEQARAHVAALIGASPAEIVLTSGSTESNNLAIKGLARANRDRGNHLITCATEHKSVLDPCERLRREGFTVTVLPVDRHGRVSLERLEAAMTGATLLVSLMAVNNETGVRHPLAEVAALCRRKGVLLHTDATQAAGRVPLDVAALPVDLLSFSAHKIYGPKGVGALYVRRRRPRLTLEPLIDGGGHQGGLRSGTLPAPLIVGFGAACALAGAALAPEAERLRRLRDRLEEGILRRVSGARVNGSRAERSPVVSNISFPGVDGESLLVALDEVAVSSGSACTSASARPSYVLTAMGVPDHLARSSLLFSVGRFTTRADVDEAVEAVAATVARLRDELAPVPAAEAFPAEAWLG
jgi:cysteine desulfurase